jgi:3-oxoacyl-[acyl-carrier protein] reductase
MVVGSSRRLDDLVALVVGGAGGIGAAIVEAFVAEGAHVLVADRDHALAEQVTERLSASAAIEIDVRDMVSVQQAVQQALEPKKRIDVLINAHGFLSEVPLLSMKTEQWDEVIDVNLNGVFRCCRTVVPHMVRARQGRIINIASQIAIKGGRSLTHYSAAKAGIIGLTKSLALEVAEYGVLVNAIAPGPIETAFLAGLSPEWRAEKRADLPLGRFGLPEEVAPTAVLLASNPDGNLYVGQTLGPNSGDVMP